VLHPAFALTGILHAIGGPLLPSLAATFHLSDNQAGLLFLCYFLGTSLGALLCTRNYARSIAVGFVVLAAACACVTVVSSGFLHSTFLVMGISVGVCMSAITMFAGRNFPGRNAATLTFINFTWSVGALAAPLLAARLLLSHTYRSAYSVLAVAAAVAAVASWSLLADAPEKALVIGDARDMPNVRFIALFALLTFLEVGIENTTISWLATYTLRSEHSGAAMAAASSSLYWCGFLASRGISSLLLLRLNPMRVLRYSVVTAALAASLLIGAQGQACLGIAMFVFGAALAPIFPLLLSRFFGGARHTYDARWVLAICGFGGSVLPWFTGWLSNRTGSLRIGLITVPASLLLMICTLPALRDPRNQHVEKCV
jgi:fucose permease